MTNQPIDPPSTACAGGVPAALLAKHHQVAELSQTLWAARRPDEIMDTVTRIECLESALDALELGVVHELEATHAVKDIGWASTVRLAAAVGEPLMAPVAEALADWWLSTAKAQVIRRAIDDLPGSPALRHRGVTAMLTEAKALDATDLRKVGKCLLARIDPHGDERRVCRVDLMGGRLGSRPAVGHRRCRSARRSPGEAAAPASLTARCLGRPMRGLASRSTTTSGRLPQSARCALRLSAIALWLTGS